MGLSMLYILPILATNLVSMDAFVPCDFWGPGVSTCPMNHPVRACCDDANSGRYVQCAAQNPEDEQGVFTLYNCPPLQPRIQEPELKGRYSGGVHNHISEYERLNV
jgi:hypothetical protein